MASIARRIQGARAGVLALAAALLASACSGATPSPSPSGAASPSGPGPTEPSAPAAPTVDVSGPPLTFAVDPAAEPVVTRAMTGIDESYINPGAVIDDDGTLHMFANVFTAWPGRVQVPHLVSSDGSDWTLDPAGPALTSDDVAAARPGVDVSTGYIAADGTWVLIFETVQAAEPWSIGRATAPGPGGPWTIDPEPLLAGGPAGSWDAGGLSWPSVVQTAAGYAMYYQASDRQRGLGAIGLATSTDGLAWTKHEAPVLEAALDWERRSLDRPRVVATPDGLVMVYAGGRLSERGVAWSSDGVTWARGGPDPAITAASFPTEGDAWDAALIRRGSTLEYFLEIGLEAGTEVYRFTAELP